MRHTPRIIDVLEPDYDDPKEPYAFFGLAAYWAQCFEQSMILLITATNILNKNPMKARTVDDIYAALDRQSLGTLIRQLSKLTTVEQDMEGRLKDILAKRNYLMHRFFSENSAKWYEPSSRRTMIDELRDLAQALQDGDNMLTSLYIPLWERLGISDDLVRQELEKLKGSAAP